MLQSKVESVSFQDVLIIGAGISGLSTAINYKYMRPKENITLIDQVTHLSSPYQASSVNCGIIEPSFIQEGDSLD